MKKIKKRILIGFLTFVIAFTSVVVPCQKAQAMDLVVTPPVVISGTSYVIASLLALCGVGIAVDKKQEIEEYALGVYEDLKTYVQGVDETIASTLDEWLETGHDGLISLRDGFAKHWELFKEFCKVKYYDVNFGTIVADVRPDITDWPYKGDKLSTFLQYYTNAEKYPYYIVVDRSEALGVQSVAMCFDNVPLIYNKDGTLYLYWFSAPDTATEFHRYSVDVRPFNSITSIYQTNKLAVNNSSVINDYTEELNDVITCNVPIFDSRQAAIDWWNNEGIGGVITPPTDIPVVKIPDTAPDVIFGRDDALGGYDVIGGTSYVDKDGNVVAGDVSLPNWDTLVGVGQGSATWDDVIGDNVAVDVPVDGTLNDALDVPIGSDAVQGSVSDKLTDSSSIQSLFADLKGVFPFCIPFDLIDCVKLFNSEPVAPHFEWTMDLNPVFDFQYTFVIDLAPFESLAYLCRVLFTILFIISLAFATRNIIRG